MGMPATSAEPPLIYKQAVQRLLRILSPRPALPESAENPGEAINNISARKAIRLLWVEDWLSF